jgi:exodeoxyribonuclease VII small subunit
MERIEELSFEQAIAELESIVQKLEGEGLSLSETEALYERGRALSARCQNLLEATSLRVEQLGQGENGAPLEAFQSER